MRRRGFVVCLEARPETIAARLAESSEHVSERPLLQGGAMPANVTRPAAGACTGVPAGTAMSKPI